MLKITLRCKFLFNLKGLKTEKKGRPLSTAEISHLIKVLLVLLFKWAQFIGINSKSQKLESPCAAKQAAPLDNQNFCHLASKGFHACF